MWNGHIMTFGMSGLWLGSVPGLEVHIHIRSQAAAYPPAPIKIIGGSGRAAIGRLQNHPFGFAWSNDIIVTMVETIHPDHSHHVRQTDPLF